MRHHTEFILFFLFVFLLFTRGSQHLAIKSVQAWSRADARAPNQESKTTSPKKNSLIKVIFYDVIFCDVWKKFIFNDC